MANPEVGYDAEAMEHSAQSEIGLALGITPESASQSIDLALALTRRLPQTFAALEDGAITLPTARAIVEEAVNLDVAQCAHLEKAVLAKAAGRTTGSIRRAARREVEKLDGEAVRKRREKAVAERSLYVTDEPDRMATLHAYLPREQAHACFTAIDALAHPKAAGDDRPVGARRAHALVDLIAAATGTDPRTPPAPQSCALTAEQIAELNRGAEVYVPRLALRDTVPAGTSTAASPAAGAPPPAATSTTASPLRPVAAPSTPTWRPSAASTTRSSRCPAGPVPRTSTAP
ncbi:DUF222 domain-containing protein [Sporichthya sp.]|uniref:DUF222 domain-containing protein n=1 Tax=Sporichthya sp. TaxID=65475 RepID=UPI0025F9828D|nr:DUF222 domain-containing protein [Sporichthya sp.]